jgi:hypothetical protein
VGIAESLTLGIVRRSATQAFPEAVEFEVTDYSGAGFTTVTDGAYTETLHLEHFWAFDDAYNFTAQPRHATVATALSYTDFNAAGASRSPKSAHTFRAAGTYNVTVSVWGYVSGVLTEATGSLSVTVGTPDYATTKTIYVDPAGLYAGKPDGAQEATTISAAVALLSGTDPMRIMLRTGVTHTISAAVSFNAAASARSVYFCSDTPGTKAVVNCTLTSGTALTWNANTGQASPIDWRMQDVEMYGDVDPTNSLRGGGGVSTTIGLEITSEGPQMFLLDRCLIRNFLTEFNPAPTAGYLTGFHAFNDTEIRAWHQWGFYDFGREAGIFTGCRFAQDVDAYSDAAQGDVYGEAMRGDAFTGATDPHTILDKCEIFNRTEDQALRLLSDGIAGSQAFVTQCVMESSTALIDVLAVDPASSTATNVVVNSNILIGSAYTAKLVDFKVAGVTFKNNICFIPSSTERKVNVNAFVEFNTPLIAWSNAGDPGRPIRAFSNTFVCLGHGYLGATSPTPSAVITHADYTDTDVVNNILHLPIYSVTVSNLDAMSVLSPVYKGFFDSIPTGGYTSASPDPDTTSLDDFGTFAPLTGSAAIGGATTGTVASHDFVGANRVAIAASHSRSPSDGAIEPNLAS